MHKGWWLIVVGVELFSQFDIEQVINKDKGALDSHENLSTYREPIKILIFLEYIYQSCEVS